MFTARPSPAPVQAAWPRSMRSVFWNRTTVEALPFGRSPANIFRGVVGAYRGDVAKRSASDPLQAPATPHHQGSNFPAFVTKDGLKSPSPHFLAIIRGFAGTARIVIRDHGASDLGYRHPSWRGEAGAPGPVQICTRPIGTGCLKSIGVSTWHAFAT
jgi:hypothetical protein